jgi:hypothetical protein
MKRNKETDLLIGLGFRRATGATTAPDGSWRPAAGVEHPPNQKGIFTRTRDGTFVTGSEHRWTALGKNVDLSETFTEVLAQGLSLPS